MIGYAPDPVKARCEISMVQRIRIIRHAQWPTTAGIRENDDGKMSFLCIALTFLNDTLYHFGLASP
jgi:hypothetical protein